MNEELFKPYPDFGKSTQTAEPDDTNLHYSCCLPRNCNFFHVGNVDGRADNCNAP